MFNSKYTVTIEGINTPNNFKVIMAEPNAFEPVTIGTDGSTVYAIVDKKFVSMGLLEQQARLFAALAAAHQDDIIAEVFAVDLETIDRDIEMSIDEIVDVMGDLDLSFFTPALVYKAAEVSTVFGKKIAKKIIKSDLKVERKLAGKVLKDVACEPWKTKATKKAKADNKAAMKSFKAYASEVRKTSKAKPEVVDVDRHHKVTESDLDTVAAAI